MKNLCGTPGVRHIFFIVVKISIRKKHENTPRIRKKESCFIGMDEYDVVVVSDPEAFELSPFCQMLF